ncbi:protein of unknown function [Pseudomonas mediterranea]
MSKPWRGDLSPLGRAAALKPDDSMLLAELSLLLGAAAQPSGDESPRHGAAVPVELLRCSFCVIEGSQ